jgi:STE24 endopeptidase
VIDGMSVLHHDRVYFWIAEQCVALGLPLVLLFGGFGARICHACGRIVRGRWFWTAVLFAAVYVLLSMLLLLPIDYVASQRLPAWGMPAQNLWSWSSQELSNVLRLALIGAALGWVPFWIIRLSPKRWWLWAGVTASVATALLLTARPIWIDPLTARYGALEDPAWKERIDKLGQRVGIDHVNVLVQHLSSAGDCDNTTGTVEGIGITRRLILGDAVFKHSTEREVTATIAHELKHYRLDATWKPLVIVAGLIAAGMLAIALISAAPLRRGSKIFGFSFLADPASLPLLVLSARLFLLIEIPVTNLLSQHIEHEADRFALELTRDNDAVAHEVADVCGPFIHQQTWFDRLYFDNHPSLDERVRFAQSYRPWEQGKPLIYSQYFE